MNKPSVSDGYMNHSDAPSSFKITSESPYTFNNDVKYPRFDPYLKTR